MRGDCYFTVTYRDGSQERVTASKCTTNGGSYEFYWEYYSPYMGRYAKGNTVKFIPLELVKCVDVAHEQ